MSLEKSLEKTDLIAQIKEEYQLLGERFEKVWLGCGVEHLQYVLKNLRARRLRTQEFEPIRIQNLLNEPIPQPLDWANSVFYHSTGGGRRNVRGTSSFS